MKTGGAKYWNSGAIPLIAPEILGDIIAEVADIGIVTDETGQVLSVMVNPDSDIFRPLEDYEGRDIRSTLTSESIEKFDARLSEFLQDNATQRGVELNHNDGGTQYLFPVRYSFHRIGPDGSILLLGRDLRPVAEMQQQLVDAQLALERDYEAQRESDTRFRVMMEATNDAMAFVSLQTGQITEANTVAASLLGLTRDDLTGKPLARELETRKKGDLIEALTGQAMSDRPGAVPVTAARGDVKLLITPTIFRAAGQRLLLCRIEHEDSSAGRTDAQTQNLVSLFAKGPDAIVFTTHSGAILSANESFLDLVDVAHDINVKNRNMADYLQRGSVDLKVMVDNAGRSGQMRVFPTKVSGAFGTPRPVEIAVTAISAGDDTIFGFVLRDASRIDQIRPVNQPVNDSNVRSVMELVGSASLKEIVAETTNVVEKMCIETAVELTMNNRVAAAEMLGLSRQSLYVKLRKYDILDRDDAE